MPTGLKKADDTRDLGSRVADQLAEGLFSGRWRAGDLLPKETELCETFGVSRASVRTGLQILTALGAIRRISGHGTVVEEFDLWNILDPAMTRWMTRYAPGNTRFITDIFMFRQAAEPYISAVAAGAATARDLLAMEEAYGGMRDTVELGTTDRADAHGMTFSDYDVAFHAAIYRATHNVVWARMAHILSPALHLVVHRSNTTAEELRDSLERHRNLMECIRLRQPDKTFEAARSVMARTAYDLGLQAEAAADASLLDQWKASLGLVGYIGDTTSPNTTQK